MPPGRASAWLTPPAIGATAEWSAVLPPHLFVPLACFVTSLVLSPHLLSKLTRVLDGLPEPAAAVAATVLLSYPRLVVSLNLSDSEGLAVLRVRSNGLGCS